MLEFIDDAAIANQVSLLRDTYQGTVLLVEGADDGCVFEKFMARDDQCRVIPAHGKTNAIGALNLLRQRGLGNCVLVIVDADFWHLTSEVPEDRNIFTTDFHDLEMDIVSSQAFDDVLRELADALRVDKFERTCGCPLRTWLLTEAGKIGLARLVSYKEGLSLRFRDVAVERHVHEREIVVDLEAYLREVLENSAALVDLAYLRMKMGQETLSDYHLPQLARGHDYAMLLAVGLRSALASQDPAIASPEHLEAVLRLSYSREHFSRGALSASVEQWESDTGCLVFD